MTTNPKFSPARTVAWLCLGVIWGSNFIFMKWAMEVISPLQVVLVRVALGFLPVALFAIARRAARRSGQGDG